MDDVRMRVRHRIQRGKDPRDPEFGCERLGAVLVRVGHAHDLDIREASQRAGMVRRSRSRLRPALP